MNGNKVYVVVEKFAENASRDPENTVNYILSVNETFEGAVSRIRSAYKETFDDITGCDENNTSSVSVAIEWNGKYAALENDACSNWEWRIEERDLMP